MDPETKSQIQPTIDKMEAQFGRPLTCTEELCAVAAFQQALAQEMGDLDLLSELNAEVPDAAV